MNPLKWYRARRQAQQEYDALVHHVCNRLHLEGHREFSLEAIMLFDTRKIMQKIRETVALPLSEMPLLLHEEKVIRSVARVRLEIGR